MAEIEKAFSIENQSWPKPSRWIPVAIIGGGGVVRDAHLPSYKKIGLPVYGVFDINKERREKLHEDFGVSVFDSLENMIADIKKNNAEVIYDVATPPDVFMDVLSKLPNGSRVLLQKPLGKDFEEAKKISQICEEKDLICAVNQQVRFSPNMIAIKNALDSKLLGEVYDIIMTVYTHTPFNEWKWLELEERVEILFHSVHYLDLIRHLMGEEPLSVYCEAGPIPTKDFEKLTDTRNTTILNFKCPTLRCLVTTNHQYHGPGAHINQLRIEGTKGCVVATTDRNFDYRTGTSDKLIYSPDGKHWRDIPLRGSWFPEAFEGPICNLERFVLGEDTVLNTSVRNVLGTMAIVEACYISHHKKQCVTTPAVYLPAASKEITIVDLIVKDIRFPTSKEADGSDAMHLDPDYSAPYIVLHTNRRQLEGHGLTFTLGRGNEICVKAIESLQHMVVGRTLDSITRDFAGFYRELTSETQMRWLGPEKGVMHLAVAAILNAIWDLYAKSENKPLWKLLSDMEPEKLVSCIDFRYMTDALTKEEAIKILKDKAATKKDRENILISGGLPAYTTSVGWYGYPEDKVRKLCRDALAEGWTHFKMKVGANLEEDDRRASIIREEIGWENKLGMDANQRWDVDEAISHVKFLAKYKPNWIEEPTSPDDILGHAKIAKALLPMGIGVATGEQCSNRVMFKQLMQANAISFCQIDSCRLGSVNENLAVILMAAKYNIPVCPHSGGVGLCEYVQHLAAFDYVCVAGTQENRVVEYVDHLHQHFKYPVKIRNGRYVVPTVPGYSIDMKEDTLRDYEFPYGCIWKDTTNQAH